jgi:hypothetical protein
VRWGVAAAVLSLSAGAAAQAQAPLRKTDLIRLLTSAALNHAEIADLVKHNCLSFTPTARDRQDLIDLGADPAIMRQVDGCRGKVPASTTVPTRTLPPVVRGAPQTAPPASPAPFATAPASLAAPWPDHTAFVSGMGQRGTVGEPATLPLVFEVKDSSGRALRGARVTVTADNARLGPHADVTDSLGRVRISVIFGLQAGRAVVRAQAGAVFRSATLYPTAAAPSRLTFRVGAATVDTGLTLTADSTVALGVGAADRFGNAVLLGNVTVHAADEGVLKVLATMQDTLAATVTLRARHAGVTVLAVETAGIAGRLRATVVRRP